MRTLKMWTWSFAFILLGACGGGTGGGGDPENTSAACQDSVDNDGDGDTDCADSDCADFTFCVPVLCGNDPCDENATCDDTSGEVQCACNTGWEGDGLSCTNIDECSEDTDDCDHTCTDTDGSYLCSCDAGYLLNPDGHTCDDVDECIEGTHNCDQLCADIDGTYVCSCLAGYDLNADGHSCDIRDCGTTAAPDHGIVSFPAGTTFGATALYYCDSGYYLLGSAERACDASAIWADDAPTCPWCDLASNNDCLCEGTADEIYCDGNSAVTCDASEQLTGIQDCGDEFCVPGLGCQVCLAGQFNCFGDAIRQCNPGPPAFWEDTGTVCSAVAGFRCDATQGVCVDMTPIGSTTPTGTYYRYATFTAGGGVYLGGNDVDSYGDYIYVNRASAYLDIYQIQILDSDGDGVIEPNQHPNNPNHTGPIEQRVLTHVNTFTKAGDNVPLGGYSVSEIYAEADRVFMLGPNHDGDISEWLFSTHTASVVADSLTNFPLSHLGRGTVDGLWYGMSESNRRVYSFHAASQSWTAEFEYPNLAGSHADGLEAVADPNTGVQYVYVSDMRSDYLGQYRRDGAGDWVQENLFQYNDVTGDDVEGMGFGALNHFWVTSWADLYELGGGDLAPYVE